MIYDPTKHNRRSVRLKNYDYSRAGAYFVTSCAYKRECLFGHITNGKMVLNNAGMLVEYTWNDLPNHNSHLHLDAFIIMPNHIHGIIILHPPIVGAGSQPAQWQDTLKPDLKAGYRAGYVPAHTAPGKAIIKSKQHGLPEIVRQFRTFSSKRINMKRKMTGTSVWQRNYYERIIRDENELNHIRDYIINNPSKWDEDEENPRIGK